MPAIAPGCRPPLEGPEETGLFSPLRPVFVGAVMAVEPVSEPGGSIVGDSKDVDAVFTTLEPPTAFVDANGVATTEGSEMTREYPYSAHIEDAITATAAKFAQWAFSAHETTWE